MTRNSERMKDGLKTEYPRGVAMEEQNKIKLTIITPHYNMPDTLRRLVDSISKEDWIEHIIVDDKSDIEPGSLNDAKAYVTAQGSIWIDNTTEKKGAGVCRDIGVEHARGKWITFIDSDDFYVEGAFQTIAKHLDDKEDIIYFPPTSVFEGTNEPSQRHVPYMNLVNEYLSDRSKEHEIHLRYQSAPAVSKMIRSSMIHENNIHSSDTPVGNDVMFSMQCACHAKSITADEKTIYCITKSKGTLTTAKDVKRYRKRLDIYTEWLRYLKQNLPEDEYAMTGISARGLLFAGLLSYGPIELIRSIRYLRKNKVPINPFCGKVR